MTSLSVVVTILGNGSAFTSRCLEALLAQEAAPPMDIVVALYPTLDDGAGLRRSFPMVRFIDIPDDPPRPETALEHMNYDRRRAVGLAAAGGDLIAMTDDYAIPGRRWCAAMCEQHRNTAYVAIGGGIEIKGSSLLNRAVYYCDFGRYQPPFPAGAANWLSASNVCYKRAALERCREVWQDLYDETLVHTCIRENGGTLLLTPAVFVGYDRGALRIGRVLRQKRASGRVFAGRRAQQISGAKRMLYAVFSPALAPMMLLRMFLMLRRQGKIRPFLASAPLTLLCLLCWSAGELTGYLTAEPFPCRVHKTEAQTG